jgi:epoxide hydrolase-like predicted phosphatase
MSIRAIYFDHGGVISRTEYQVPRQHLAERLNMEYEDIVRIVFDSPSGRQATVGAITAAQHWNTVLKRLRLPRTEMQAVRDEFFGGDVLDHELIDTLRDLRSNYFVGLISNAWDDLREYIVAHKYDDAFEHMVISAEVGVAKPDAKIFQIALEQAGVNPDEAVFVDDFIENIQGCQELGMQGIHFRGPEQAMDELKQILS